MTSCGGADSSSSQTEETAKAPVPAVTASADPTPGTVETPAVVTTDDSTAISQVYADYYTKLSEMDPTAAQALLGAQTENTDAQSFVDSALAPEAWAHVDFSQIADVNTKMGYIGTVTWVGAMVAASPDENVASLDTAAVIVTGDTATVPVSAILVTVNGEASTPATEGEPLNFIKKDGVWFILATALPDYNEG